MDFDICVIVGPGIYDAHYHGDFEHVHKQISLSGNLVDVNYLMMKNDDRNFYIIVRNNGSVPEPEILYLSEQGCNDFVGFHSLCSLKNEYHLSTLVLPSDFISTPNRNFLTITHRDIPRHVMSRGDETLIHEGVYPELNHKLKGEIFHSLYTIGHKLVNIGTVVQNNINRFETHSEIRLYSNRGDFVGHTLGDECCLINSVGGRYAVVGIIDTMGKGLDERKDKSSLSNYLHNNDKHSIIVRHAIQSIIRDFRSPKIDMKSADLLIHGRYVVTCESVNSEVLNNYTVVIDKGIITDLLPTDSVLMSYISRESRYRMSHAIIPGLINCHTHNSMSLLRGYCDDVNLFDWLHNHIWPIEQKFCHDNDFLIDGMKLAIGEMLHGGVTCFNDMYHKSESMADICIKFGIRAVLGYGIIDSPDCSTRTQLTNHENTMKINSQKKESSLISYAVCPHSPYTVSDDTWKLVKEFAMKYNIPIHSHIHETAKEVEDSINHIDSPSCHKSESRCSPIINLNRLGMFDGTHFIAVHMTCLTKEEIEIIKEKKVNVVHNPTSNLKLASGMCPVKTLLDNQVNVAIGTDSCASNNSLSLLSEMKLAAILGSAVAGNASAVTAREVLYMATKSGAIALGLDNKIGSLEIGKYADITAIDIDRLEMVPLFDVISQIVYSAGRDNVTDVWIEGKNVVRNQLLSLIDEKELIKVSHSWGNKIQRWKEQIDK